MSMHNAGMVLVVDDDDSIRELVAAVLRGYPVIMAAGVGTALSLLDAQPVALVITDISMPGDSGLHLVREIRARHGQTRTILMSARPDVSQLAQACGADRWFAKGDTAIMELHGLVGELLS